MGRRLLAALQWIQMKFQTDWISPGAMRRVSIANKRLDEITCFACHKASFRLPTEEWERTIRSGDQPFSACISVEILIVAKLENVSDTAYGKMIWPLCLIAPQV